MNSLNNSLEKAAKFVNTNKSFITNIYRYPLYNDEPKLFVYSGIYKSRYKRNSDVSCGLSFDKNVALMRVLGEGIERYCLEHYKPKIVFVGRIQDVKKDYLDPHIISAFSNNQLVKSNFKKFRITNKSLFRWTKGFSLTRKKSVLIPAQLVSFNYTPMENEPTILLPISTGAAAGLYLNGAIYRGVCEVVERDAFMISYLNKLSCPKIDIQSIKDTRIQKILGVFKRYKLELIVLDITTDIKIPAFVALTLDTTSLGPAVSVGLKAGFDIKESIIGAIEESLMTRSWIRDKFIYLSPNYQHKKIIGSLEDRAHFWYSINMINKLRFWLDSKNIKKITNHEEFHITKNNLNTAMEFLKKNKMEIIYADITDQTIKKNGFFVIRTIIPQLHPLHLDEKYRYLGGKRLYNAPVEMGLLKKPNLENQLNNIPHPFL